jgi:hypothetical protein
LAIRGNRFRADQAAEWVDRPVARRQGNAERTLSFHRARIEHIARNLLLRGELDGVDIERLLP